VPPSHQENKRSPPGPVITQHNSSSDHSPAAAAAFTAFPYRYQLPPATARRLRHQPSLPLLPRQRWGRCRPSSRPGRLSRRSAGRRWASPRPCPPPPRGGGVVIDVPDPAEACGVLDPCKDSAGSAAVPHQRVGKRWRGRRRQQLHAAAVAAAVVVPIPRTLRSLPPCASRPSGPWTRPRNSSARSR
jgi:hypothetical protein